MPDDVTTTRWTVSGSRAPAHAGRSVLAHPGRKKGELCRFIEDAVKWRVLDQTMAEARTGFADLAPEAVEDLVDEADTATRHPRKPAARPAR